MVPDSSALAAIIFDEPEVDDFLELIDAAPQCLISPATIVEVDAAQAAVARDAWRRFGRGRHPASLNLGDLFAYALAQVTNMPLLCKGRDFSQTDVVLAA